MINVLAVWYLINNKLKLSRTLIYFIGIFIISIFIHYYSNSLFPTRTIFGILSRIFAGFFVFSLLKEKILNIYVKIFTFLSKISLILFISFTLFPSLFEFVKNHAIRSESFGINNILFYSLLDNYRHRNPGPFWEPGAFAGYLIIALIFEFLLNKNTFTKRYFLFSITLLTTQSTTGILALFLITIFHLYKNHKINKVFKPILLLSLISISTYMYMNSNLLSEKINNQIEYGLDYRSGHQKYSSARFVHFFRDLDQIIEKPIFGWGVSNETRLLEYDEHYASITNGTTDLIVRYGFFGFFLFSLGLYNSFYRINQDMLYSLFIVFIIYFISFSEAYFRYTFIFCLPLLTTLRFKFNAEETLNKVKS
ncbi:O-antigen ligase family protein [Roseimarinus sediminis]|uniref:O-antigen ligase family protein n=1 Tax=Roseimarinus sediminis TaxID=1610899 RepID=UPI003D244EFD